MLSDEWMEWSGVEWSEEVVEDYDARNDFMGSK